MRLSKHFTLAELIRSATAESRGIDSTPGAVHLANLQRLAGQIGASANPIVDYRDAVLRHHMWCFDGTKHRFYVNGVEVGVKQESVNPQPSFADLRLRVGGSSSAGSNYSGSMAGHIMSLAVFDVDLSADPGQFDDFSGYIAGRMA